MPLPPVPPEYTKIPGSPNWRPNVRAPNASLPRTPATVQAGLSDLADRTAWLREHTVGAAGNGVTRFRTVAGMLDLAAIDDMQDGDVVMVTDIGLYRFDANSTEPGSNPAVVPPSSGEGRWHFFARLLLGAANGIATLDSAGHVPHEQLNRGQSNGVASLNGDGRVPTEELGAGVPGYVASLDNDGKVPNDQIRKGEPGSVVPLSANGTATATGAAGTNAPGASFTGGSNGGPGANLTGGAGGRGAVIGAGGIGTDGKREAALQLTPQADGDMRIGGLGDIYVGLNSRKLWFNDLFNGFVPVATLPVGAEGPTNAQDGQLWLDTSGPGGARLKVYFDEDFHALAFTTDID